MNEPVDIFFSSSTGRGIKLKLLGVKLQKRITVNFIKKDYIHPAEY